MDITQCLLHPQNKAAFYCYQCNHHLCTLCARISSHALIRQQDYQDIVGLLHHQSSPEVATKQRYDIAINMLPSILSIEEKVSILNKMNLVCPINDHTKSKYCNTNQYDAISAVIQNDHAYEIAVLKKEIESLKKEVTNIRSNNEQRLFLKYENKVIDKINENEQRDRVKIKQNQYEMLKISNKLHDESEVMKQTMIQLIYESISDKIIKKLLCSVSISNSMNSKGILNEYKTHASDYIKKYKAIINDDSPMEKLCSMFKESFYVRSIESLVFNVVECMSSSLTMALLTKEKDLFSNDKITSNLLINKTTQLIENENAIIPIPTNVQADIISNFKLNFYDRIIKCSEVNIIDVLSASLTNRLLAKERMLISNTDTPQSIIIEKFKEFISIEHSIIPIPQNIQNAIFINFKNHFFEKAGNIIAASLTNLLIIQEKALLSNAETSSDAIITKFKELMNSYIASHNEFSLTENVKNMIIDNFKLNFYERVLQNGSINIIDIISSLLTTMLFDKDHSILLNAGTSSEAVITKLKEMVNEYFISHNDLSITDNVKQSIIHNFKLHFYERALMCSAINITDVIASSLTLELIGSESNIISNTETSSEIIIAKYIEVLNKYIISHKEFAFNDRILNDIVSDFKAKFFDRATNLIATFLTTALISQENALISNAETPANIVISKYKELLNKYATAHIEFAITDKVKDNIVNNFKANFYERAMQCNAMNIIDIISASLTIALLNKKKALLSKAETSSNTIITEYNKIINDYAIAHKALPINDKAKASILKSFKTNFYCRTFDLIGSSMMAALVTKEKGLISTIETTSGLLISKYNELIGKYAASHKEFPLCDDVKRPIIDKFKLIFLDFAAEIIASTLTNELIKREKAYLIKTETLSATIISKYTQLINEYAASHNEFTMSDKAKDNFVKYFKANFYERVDKFYVTGYTVLKYTYLPKINQWINKYFSLNLLYRASRDGYSRNDFHKLCDNKGPTLIILKNNYGKIIGGFTPLSWTVAHPPMYKCDDSEQSFLFSITTGCKYALNPSNKSKAICCNVNSGPCFGNKGTFELNDIDDCRTTNSCHASIENGVYYDKETFSSFSGGIDQHFSIVDYEVFEVAFN